MLLLGSICDIDGNHLPQNTPPPLQHCDANPDDWTPYQNRLQFELAEFLFKRNQMSGGDIDILLNLWGASLAEHSDEPPFSSHKELYKTIDATPIGGVPWESFSVQYNGVKPNDDIPNWMSAEYDVWF